MRTIIAGTRRTWDLELIREAIKESGFDVTYIIVGGAAGIDRAAEDIAVIDKIDHLVVRADWDKYGGAAGPIRNVAMADAGAEGLIALPDAESIGTRHMIKVMRERGLPVYVKEL